MGLVEILLIGIGLSMDALAVAIVASITLGKVTSRQFFRLSFHFGLFQAIMPVFGWLAGQTLDQWIQTWDHWLAFALLVSIGLKMAYEAFSNDDEVSSAEPQQNADPTRGLKLLALSLATSIDAMAVGLSFAMLRISIALPVIIIGCITATLTFAGMKLGAHLGMRFGKRMQILGGCVLVGIGIKIVVQHLMA